MIDTLVGPYACVQAIGAFAAAHAAALPVATVEGLVTDLALPSPVDRLVNGCERIWACGLADLAEPAKSAAATLVAQIAACAVANGWNVIGSTDRGPLMVGACRRILGEDGADQDPADDPPPLADYIPPEA